MAGVSSKEIKNRIRSMESTKQITKAMEMVAASKLRHAQAAITNSRPYFEILHDTLQSIINNNRDFSSPYLQTRDVEHTLFLVIGGDRGLAGGYNSNILKAAVSGMQNKSAVVFPIGKKSYDYFKAHNYKIYNDAYQNAAEISISDCFTIAKQISEAYLTKEFDEVYLYYTDYVSVLSQNPDSAKLLPFSANSSANVSGTDILYEPDCTEVFSKIIPEYLGGFLYGALCESRASEHAARRTAMDSATQNADDMIADLSLKFNQARQAAITQEITEIVAGA